jgi:hypothetical protein
MADSKPNEWQRPETEPPGIFVGKKERDLVYQLNSEIQERVIGQAIAYYSISAEHSSRHDLYNESINKVSYPPVRIYAMVDKQESEVRQTKYGIDQQRQINVYFHKRRLVEDQDVFVRAGDYVAWSDELYEIVKVTQPKHLWGKDNDFFEVATVCRRARRSAFRVL